MTHLLLTVRFLDDRYHGLLDRGGPPEWPPSPFRLFQALVAGVARRGELVIGEDFPANTNFTDIGKALGWLQRHTRENPPMIIAPKSKTGQAITRFVPNNDGDRKFDRQERLTAKPTIPTLFLLEPDQKPEVHYIWDISNAPEAPVERIRDAARSLTALGWGIDMAFADADRADEAKLQMLKGIRWHPKKNAGSFEDTLRVPTYDDKTHACTLCDLRHCHSTFISRIEHGKPLKTVHKPKVFDRILYTSIERRASRPYCVFRLRFVDANGEEIRSSYPHAKLIHIAGMTRHEAIKAMAPRELLLKLYPDGFKAEEGISQGYSPPWIKKEDQTAWVESFVAGHRPAGVDGHKQFSYIPLPSIGHEHADALIRNIMVVAPFGCDRELGHMADQLDGKELHPEGPAGTCETREKPRAALRICLERFTPPHGQFIAERYLGTSCTWHSVTPVILPGHDEHKPARAEQLILKAMRQSGIEQPCEFTWGALPYLKNCLTAHKYDQRKQRDGYYRPNHLDHFTAKHVRLTFDQPVRGPVAIGAGRHCGLGIFASQ